MKNYKRLIFGILTILWCLIIYSFSNASGETSGGLSLKITQFFIELLYPSFSKLDIETQIHILDIIHIIIRKFAHMGEFAILYLFTYEFVSTFKKTYIQPFVFTVGYAFLDEFHQLFINERAGSVVDVLIDSIGAIMMLLFIHQVEKYLKKKNSKSKLMNL